MQRVTKYPLLLKEILKHTEPTHPDYAALDKCYTRIAEVVLGSILPSVCRVVSCAVVRVRVRAVS
jgi:hypothetical protein